jgi:signal peptidase I
VLCSGRQDGARDLRVGRTISACASDRSKRAKEHALHDRWRHAKHDDVAELLGEHCELQWIRHAPGVGVAESRKTEQRLEHVSKALAGGHLHTDASVAVARIPPVVPHARLDDRRFALAQNGCLPVALHSQLPLECGESLDHRRMAVLANHARANEGRQLSGRAALGVRVRKLKDDRSLSSDRVLEDLADTDRSAVRRAIRIGVRHAHTLTRGSYALAVTVLFGPRPRRYASGVGRWIRGGAIAVCMILVVCGVAVASQVRAHVTAARLQPYRVPSQAMAPTLRAGQTVYIGTATGLRVGDVVVFYAPTGAVQLVCGSKPQPGAMCDEPTPTRATARWIKRIVAGPGDTIAMRDGRVILNGRALDEPFIDVSLCGHANPACTYPRPIRIPDGYYFMLGDSRGASADSRFWGPVPRAWIIGRVETCVGVPDPCRYLQ